MLQKYKNSWEIINIITQMFRYAIPISYIFDLDLAELKINNSENQYYPNILYL